MASPHNRTPSAVADADPDNPQSMVIASLRSQVGDLLTQVTQLNGKLVQSYDRISDLEDNLHITSSAQRQATLQISALELERTQHLAALNTGLLVEKSHVTSELNRLMERATEEAAKAGQAETAKREIEQDLDDLSAELFGRANAMVVEARLAQAASERRVQEAEIGLRGAEEAVRAMQEQMQALREEKDRADRAMDKGKWVDRPGISVDRPLRLLSTIPPYTEFLLFVAHLRQLRPTSPQPPPISTLLPLPFLARLIAEDSDPTLRLEIAPALNWLTRRTVTAAIHASQLTVEPLPIAALSSQYPDPHAATCALCGKTVLPSPSSPSRSPPALSNSFSTAIAPTLWRPSFLKNSSNQSIPPPPARNQPPQHIHSPTPSVATTASFYPPSTSTPPPTPPLTSQELPPLPNGITSEPDMIYVFRLQTQTPAGAQHPGSTPTQLSFPHPHSSTPSIIPLSSRTTSNGSQVSQTSTFYPLCTSGWCLARLRSTCELWRFVRVGVVASVWEEEVPMTPVISPNGTPVGSSAASPGSKPPVPPRRRGLNIGVGKLFGMASNALSKGTNSPSKSGSPVPPTPAKEDKSSAILSPPPLPRRNDTRDKMREARASRERIVSVAQKESISPPSKTDESKSISPTPTEPSEIPLPRSPVEMLFDHDEHDEQQEKVVDSEKITDSSEKKDGVATEEMKADTEEKKTGPVDEKEKEREIEPVAKEERPEASAEKAEVDGAKTEVKEAKQETSDSGPATLTPGTPVKASPPSRIASPAPDETRTGSPAPPPLPRRAARRAVPAPPGTSSARGSMEVEPKPAEPETLKAAEPRSEEPSQPTSLSPEVTRDEKSKEPTVEFSPLPPPTHPSHAEGVPPPPVRRIPPPLPDRVPDENRSVMSTKSTKTTISEESGQFVGDATWEERTWKTLARLREDMFYARTGCVR